MQQKLISYNRIFMQNDACGDEKNNDIFLFFDKLSYVCLSAPHATKTFTNKHIKNSDLYTGAIVKYIGEEKNFSYIVRNKFIPQKCLINDFILQNKLENHFFLDVHGMKNGNGFDLAIGTGYFDAKRYSLELGYIDILAKKYNIKYVVNHENYKGCAGLTGRLQQQTGKANVLQLEWSKNYRDIFEKITNVEKVTIPFIAELAQLVNIKK